MSGERERVCYNGGNLHRCEYCGWVDGKPPAAPETPEAGEVCSKGPSCRLHNPPPPESAPLPAQPPRHHPGCGTWVLDQTGKPLPCSCTPEVMRPAQPSREGEALAMLRRVAETLPTLDWTGAPCCPFCDMAPMGQPQPPCELAALIAEGQRQRLALRSTLEFLENLEASDDPILRPESPQATGFWMLLAEVRAALSEPGTAKGETVRKPKGLHEGGTEPTYADIALLVDEILRRGSRVRTLEEAMGKTITQLERHTHGHKDEPPDERSCAHCKVLAAARRAVEGGK